MRSSALPALPLTATGVGSLPFVEPEQAVDFVARWAPRVPFWPELPRRAESETAIGAALAGCFRWVRPGTDPGTWEIRDLAAFEAAVVHPRLAARSATERALQGAFRARRFSSAIALKLQSIGPLTLAEAVRWRGAPLDATPRGSALALRLAERAAARRLAAAESFGLPLLLQLDEPSFALVREERTRARASSLWRRLLPELRGRACAIGIHVCSALDPRDLRGRGLALLSCTAFRSLAPTPQQVFGRRRGVLLCGVVPTWTVSSSRELPPAEALVEACPSAEAWRGRVLISAACGLGLLDLRAAEASFERAHEVAELAEAALGSGRRSPRRARADAEAACATGFPTIPILPARPWVALALQLLGAEPAAASAASRRFGGPESRRPHADHIPSDPRDARALEVELLRLGLHVQRAPAALVLVRRLRVHSPRRPFLSPLASLRRIAAFEERSEGPPRSSSSATRSGGR
ncbi:MAG: hypothetical protein IPN34_03480 [Planctomycetes bacterium]|nr:hypothetical protein [Planctomycetota bacterium]